MFSLTKWYLDCVDEDGDLCIAYWASLAWRSVSLTLVSTLELRGGEVRTCIRAVRVPEPRIEDGTLRWQTDGVRFEMHRRTPAVSASLLADQVVWRCELPSCDAVVRIGTTILRGTGYAEVLTISIPPWRLPIDELRWGRFTGERSSTVWIDWRGAHPLTVVMQDGARVEPASVADTEVSFDAQRLTLDEPLLIRDAPLRSTLAEVPFLAHLLPRKIADIHEQKWRSRGTLWRDGVIADRGWSIHEVVRFP